MSNMPPHIKSGLRIFIGLLILGAVFTSGVYYGYANRPAVQKITGLANKEAPAGVDSGDFALFWKAWQTVNEKFPNAEKTPSTDRVYGAIKGMLASFKDPYTTFFTPSESKLFESEIAGEFSGIGIEIGKKDGILTVIAPLKDTPADKAGLKSGDKIIKINDQITTDLAIDKAVDLIRGETGTDVSLTIIREGFTSPKVFTLKRAKIALPTVDTEFRSEEGVFVIHLYNFSAQSPELFRQALMKYYDSGAKKLIIDLRDNPGGYLDAAVSIGSWFIPEGELIVKEIGKTDKDIKEHKSTGPNIFPKDHQLIILVNRGSASAAEILAGALSEQGIGTLVGEKTFGKGSVQEVVNLTSDTSMKVTVAKWYTPHGVSISETGLTPKVKIPDPSGTADTQLSQALKLFK